ncbi:S1-like domain-containing RNA-binding protein [Salinicola salarius]|uniref:CvfB family protein n=1 Tax=Salinicola salarius TaxID=430457 RepID=UPI0023E46358|nr:S1-like domain-containing RNA-binding protein [Salinicola salarius]MDF3920192.1 S1-like domain-containing RNA-binding protein [Salinicola salarius]
MTRTPRDNAPAESSRAAEPQVNVGDVAYLRVTKVNDIGAFLNWGRPKDLLLPFGEQRFLPDEGKRVLVMIYVDDRMRPVASMKLDRFLQDESEGLKAGDRVSLVIADLTDLGAKAVVNSRFWGLLYHDDMSRPLRRGDRVEGYVRRVRDDARLDLSLLPPGQARLDVVGDKVLAALADNDGFLALGDKSPADAIKARLGVSKNAFKQAIGRLYKQRRIVIEEDGIRLIEE